MPTIGPLQRILQRRILRPTPFARGLHGTVAFDPGGADACTLTLKRGRIGVVAGKLRHPTSTVMSDVPTLSSVLEGATSGIDAFLRGRLRVRGNLALTLQLDGIFEHDARPSAMPRPLYVNASGVRTFVLEAGEGAPVVLLHGLAATNASMLPTLADLARTHRVIAADLPGFGETDKPLRPLNAAYFARWVVALLDALGIQRAHLIGNSMGGRIAIETALRFPDRVDRLALYAPSMAFKRFRHLVPLAQLLQPHMAVVPIPLPHAGVVAGIRAIFARPDRLEAAWYDAAADEFLRVFSSARGRIAFFSAARQIYVEEARGDRGFWDRLPSLRRPALFLWGDRDPLVPPGFARHVEEALPSSESVVIDDCGHVPQFEHPERTHALVRKFFA